MTAPAAPTLTVIAGPNGAGKSTFTESARVHGTVPVLDADAIARRRHPRAPERAATEAGREMIQRQKEYLRTSVSFAVETTLAGMGILRLMEQARQFGFSIHLIYIGVDTVGATLGRIEERVARGGHGVPEHDVRRRYERSLGHLMMAIERADRATIIDNSSDYGPSEVLMINQGQIIKRAKDTPRWVSTALSKLLSKGS